MPSRRRTTEPSTRERAVAVATRLMQERGYNGFSFQDVATAIGTSHVAVHHHFPTKGDLGAAAMAAYRATFAEALAAIDARRTPPHASLTAYANLFQATLADGRRLCLCGMLTAEFTSLPASVRPHVRGFYDDNESWLAQVLAQLGLQPVAAAAEARAWLATLEGAMLSARAFDDGDRFASVVAWLLASLPPERRPGPVAVEQSQGRRRSRPAGQRRAKRRRTCITD
jgi:TetR/AcrR family transcriptional regulator, transcriptional repressor for nem operon